VRDKPPNATMGALGRDGPPNALAGRPVSAHWASWTSSGQETADPAEPHRGRRLLIPLNLIGVGDCWSRWTSPG